MKGLRLALVALCMAVAAGAHAERIKDIATVAGVRTNQLVGYGLVVGLDGTGDQTSQAPFTVQSIKNMLAQFGIVVPDNVNPQLRNVAAVTVQAELPPFAKPGQTIDITVASIGNAKSLRGGSLLMAPLRGADGEVYAIAQGNLVVSGFGAQGKDGSSISVNVVSAGAPNGATVERPAPSDFDQQTGVLLNLNTADFTTAQRLAQVINDRFGPAVAQPVDPTSIHVLAPSDAGQRVAFVAELETLELVPGEAPARVIVNSRTGTVVIGAHVQVMAAAVAHGSLSVTIREHPEVSQPEPFGRGTTEVVQRSDVEVNEENNHMFLFDPGVTLDQIVQAVNRVGAAPGDLVGILEALKEAGALRAELIVI
jgi:flagellar P-ring protein precursor FlgI